MKELCRAARIYDPEYKNMDDQEDFWEIKQSPKILKLACLSDKASCLSLLSEGRILLSSDVLQASAHVGVFFVRVRPRSQTVLNTFANKRRKEMLNMSGFASVCNTERYELN